MTALETGKKGAEKFILNNASFTDEQFSAAATASAQARYHTERSISDFIQGWLSVVGEALRGAWTNLAEAAAKSEADRRAAEEGVEIYVIRTRDGVFVCNNAEIMKHHATDSMVCLYTARAYSRFSEPEEIEAAAYDRDVRETRAAFEREQAANEDEEETYADTYDGLGNTALQDALDEDEAFAEAEAGKLLINGVLTAPEDVTVRNVPELPKTVCVRFLHDDSSIFVTHGEDGYNALKALADAADVEAARVKLHSGETLTDAELDVLYDAPEPGEEDSAAVQTGRKIIAATSDGETVVFQDDTNAIHKGIYNGDMQSDYGVWLKTGENTLKYVVYRQIMGVEKAAADLPRPEPTRVNIVTPEVLPFTPLGYKSQLRDELDADFMRYMKAATQVIAPENAGTNIPAAALRIPGGILLNPSGLDERRADLARRRTELETEEARLNAEQALADIVAALDPSNEFYISSFTLKCKKCFVPWTISLGPDSTPADTAKLLREYATTECHECAHKHKYHGEEQEDDGSIGGADDYGARGPFNLDGQRADEIEGLDEPGLSPLGPEEDVETDRILSQQELEDFADDGDRPPFLDYFNEPPF